MKTTKIRTPRQRSWLAPAIAELEQLPDSGMGFSEPDPPSNGGSSLNEREEDELRRDEEMFDWL